MRTVFCGGCGRPFPISKDTALPYSDLSKKIYLEAHKNMEDVPDEHYGAAGFTAVCSECVASIAEKHPWLKKVLEEDSSNGHSEG